MTKPIDPNAAVDFLLANAGKYADAKAARIHIEEFRKSKKALLMGECAEKAVNAREQYAYSHPVSFGQNLQITGIFTVASIARGYFVRRAFNRWGMRRG